MIKRSNRSPKRFAPPRSRAAREAAHPSKDVPIYEILRDIYTMESKPARPEMAKPWWADTARKFGWMTYGEWTHIPEEPTGRILPPEPGLKEALYASAPFFALKPKRVPA